jgi:hypothetical protein
LSIIETIRSRRRTMGATGNFKHVAETTGTLALSNAWNLTVPVTLPLQTLIQSSLFLYVDTIAGGATKTTVRVTSDTAGDLCLIPDTEAVMSTGKTTATKGTSVYKTDIVVPSGTDVVYVWVKLDAGTAVLNKVVITGLE